MTESTGPARRGRFALLIAGVAITGLAVGALAGRAVLPPGGEADLEGTDVTVEVEDRTIGSTLSLGASAEVSTSVAVTAPVAGVVTDRILDEPADVASGTEVLRVDELPVIVIDGEVPFFRDLAEGTQGRDVEQARRWLIAEGYDLDEGPGPVDAAMTTAIVDWQEESGLPTTGELELGRLVAIDGLPQRLVLDPEVAVGRTLATEEPLLLEVSDEPSFTLQLSPEQESLVPLDAGATIDGRWEAVFGERTTTDEGDLEIVLEGLDGGAPCAPECEQVPVDGATSFPLEVVAVPETSGPAVPIAALRSTADGSATVLLEDGRERDIEVIASADGYAVVDGLEPGETVVVREAEQGS